MPPVIRCFPLSEPWHRQALTPEGGDGRHNWDLICNSPHCLAASVSEAKLQLKCNRSSFFSLPFVWSWSLGFWSISFLFCFFNYSLFKQSKFFLIQYFWNLLCSYYLILFCCSSRNHWVSSHCSAQTHQCRKEKQVINHLQLCEGASTNL